MNNLQYEKARQEKVLSSLGNRAIGLEPINLSKCKRASLLIDTETIGDIKKGEKAYPYDISFLQVKNGEILHQVSFINSDIYDNEYLMNNAFYKNKIPFYNEALKTDVRYKKKNDQTILKDLNSFIKSNRITYFMAYNVKFDYNSINNLFELEKNKKIKNDFKKLYVIDIWKVATDIILMFPKLYESYMAFCKKNNLITESGLNVQTGANAMNKFVDNNPLFEECHTGLEDTFCELNILKKMLWYYEKQTGKDYYYKLDSVFNGYNKVYTHPKSNIIPKFSVKNLAIA